MEQLISLAELPRKGNVYPIHLAATGGKAEIMTALLERGTILDRKSDDLGGVLQWAVMHQDVQVVKLLLAGGADVLTHGACTKNMPGCFILALDSGHLEIITLLYESDNQVLSQKDPMGWGCVHLMCEQGKKDMLLWLVERGADLYMEKDGLNGMDLALKHNQFEVVAYLRQVTEGKLKQSEKMKQEEIKEKEQSEKKTQAVKVVTEEDRAEAIVIKDEANKLFLKEDFPGAIGMYSQALEKDPQNIQVLTNRAACYINTQEPAMALEDCKTARTVRLDWPKTFFREGEAYFQLKEYPDAASSFWEALKLDPGNKAYKLGFDKSVKAGRNQYGTQ